MTTTRGRPPHDGRGHPTPTPDAPEHVRAPHGATYDHPTQRGAMKRPTIHLPRDVHAEGTAKLDFRTVAHGTVLPPTEPDAPPPARSESPPEQE